MAEYGIKASKVLLLNTKEGAVVDPEAQAGRLTILVLADDLKLQFVKLISVIFEFEAFDKLNICKLLEPVMSIEVLETIIEPTA